MIEIYYNDFSLGLSLEKEIVNLCEGIIFDYHLKPDYVNIVFLNDEELLEINRAYLEHYYYTDIITFNYSEDPKVLEAELYLSIDRIIDNAETAGIPGEIELIRVIAHGMLHLAGFDDSTAEEKQKMRELEEYYINAISFHVKPG
jgi:probable rRNA maturation factor